MNGSENELPHSTIVSNSGPLIALATIGRLNLLKDLFGQVCIPQAVYDEVVVHGESEPGAREVDMAKEAGLIRAVKPVLDELRQTDFRMSSRIYQAILVKAGEL